MYSRYIDTNDDVFNEKINHLKERMEELKQRNSAIRKIGIDTHIVNTKFLNLTPKIRMAKATKHDDDLKKIKEILDNIDDELNEIESGDHFHIILQLIEKITKEISHEEFEKAKETYKELKKNYRELPEDLRKLIHPTCLHLFEIIENYNDKN